MNTARRPCARAEWCGRYNCPHAADCAAVLAGAASPKAPAWAKGRRGRHWFRDAWSGDFDSSGAASEGAAPLKPLPAAGNLVYLYDGSLPGFFCCVFESVYSREMPSAIVPQNDAQPTLFREKLISTNAERAKRVQASIPEKMGERARELVETVFLSCLEERELALLRFLRIGYQAGEGAPWLFGHPDVVRVLKAEEHLLGEVHLLKGFVRFSDYGGVLAAAISPKNFVLPFLAPHFAGRYSKESFIIYDKTHKAALLYENGQSRVIHATNISFPKADETEEKYRSLWKRFYNTIAIEARENPRCRTSHMPKRYWENMPEVAELV